MIIPTFLYDNAFRNFKPISFDGPIIEGKEPDNAVDWRDWTLFTTPSMVSQAFNFDVTADNTVNIDCAAMFIATTSSSAFSTVKLFYESAPAVFTELVAWVQPAVGVHFLVFPEVELLAGRKLRFEFADTSGGAATGYVFRQLAAGKCLQPEVGQHDGLNPVKFTQGLVISTSINANGSFMGRDVRRLDRRSQLSLEYQSETFMRTLWEPFAQHAARYPFFYSWDVVNHPDEAAFSVADRINGPTNMSQPGLMEVNWPLRSII